MAPDSGLPLAGVAIGPHAHPDPPVSVETEGDVAVLVPSEGEPPHARNADEGATDPLSTGHQQLHPQLDRPRLGIEEILGRCRDVRARPLVQGRTEAALGDPFDLPFQEVLEGVEILLEIEQQQRVLIRLELPQGGQVESWQTGVSEQHIVQGNIVRGGEFETQRGGRLSRRHREPVRYPFARAVHALVEQFPPRATVTRRYPCPHLPIAPDLEGQRPCRGVGNRDAVVEHPRGALLCRQSKTVPTGVARHGLHTAVPACGHIPRPGHGLAGGIRFDQLKTPVGQSVDWRILGREYNCQRQQQDGPAETHGSHFPSAHRPVFFWLAMKPRFSRYMRCRPFPPNAPSLARPPPMSLALTRSRTL